jgi:hypothetical protein
MTLSEWSKLTGILPTHPTTERGAVSVIVTYQDARHNDLWHLTDYKVSSVSGPVIWLVPVKVPVLHPCG